tara:strand:+ start:165 stop:899 length:735 start_codon:yes stop_codon:yes gene_type:complete
MALTKIGTDSIKDDAVTLAKQAAGTDGQIITYDASGNPVAVGPGTDGQVLTSTGAGSPPAFETLPTSGNSSGMQVLEMFQSPCDGSSFTLDQGTTTVETVTGVQTAGGSMADMNGSSISYVPPSGAKQVIYTFQFQIGGSPDTAAIGHFQLLLDGTLIDNTRFTASGTDFGFDDLCYFTHTFNIGGTANTTDGRVATWTSSKTIKMQFKEFSTNHEVQIHKPRYANSTNLTMPQIGITAIGALT